MTFPKISIVTPSYNQGEYIEQTILSVLNQGYPNLEYIIIDGGSTDNTLDIIRKYADRISYWVTEPDKGQSDALNKGLAKCTGDIFNWINSDDYLAEGALLKVAEAFKNNPKTELVCGYSNIFDEDSGKTIIKHRCEFFETVEKTIVEQRINQQGCFYKLDVLKQLGRINQTLNYVMDLELWFRYLCKHGQSNVLLLDDLLAHFRVHLSSKTNSFQEKFRREESGLLHFLLSNVSSATSLLYYFDKNDKYIADQYDVSAIDKKRLVLELFDKYFFDFYKKKKYAAGRDAFLSKLKRGRIPFNRQYLSLFFKLFIIDINFSKVFR